MRLVGDRPVIGDAVHLRRLRFAVVGDLGDAQFDFVRLGLLGEDGSQRLGVHIGELAAADVAPVVGIAARVGVLDAAAAQAVELVESAHRRETNTVVDLTDLLQRARRVLGHEQHAAGVGQRDHAAASGDSLARELGTLTHRLLRRDEIRKTHYAPARGASLAGPDPSLNSSVRERFWITSRASPAIRSSRTSWAPSASMVTAVG